MIKNSNRKKENENEKESNKNACPNVLFICKNCKSIPLLIPSITDERILKYCNEEKKFEVITPINLSDMINIKSIKKKLISKDKLTDDESFNYGNLICSIHGKEFINYCNDCNKDICFNCSESHFKHDIIYYSKFLPSAKDIREGNKILSEMKRDLEKFKQSTKDIIKTCESLIYIKEIMLNSLKSLDIDKLNYYSIINYKNILKIKINLFEKPFEIINPMHEMNSKILLKIRNDIRLDKKETFKGKIEINNVLSEYDLNQKNLRNKGPSSYQSKKCSQEKSYESGSNISFSIKLDKIYNKAKEKDFISKHIKSKKKKNIDKESFQEDKDINKKRGDNMQLEVDKNNMIVKIELDENSINENKTQVPYISDYEKSMIIDNQQLKFIIDAISSKVKKTVKKLYLCYRATSDGDKAISFHEKCDRLKNIIILISTNNGKKFGGFSSESWDSKIQDPWKRDENAYIFSIDNYKFYGVIKPEKAILCHKDFGPIFGNGEILIHDNFFLTPSTCLEKNVYYESNDNSFPLSGLKEFYVTQLEAYKIDYCNH